MYQQEMEGKENMKANLIIVRAGPKASESTNWSERVSLSLRHANQGTTNNNKKKKSMGVSPLTVRKNTQETGG
jgi:hypothetical protein